jgi:hypothetical protein
VSSVELDYEASPVVSRLASITYVGHDPEQPEPAARTLAAPPIQFGYTAASPGPLTDLAPRTVRELPAGAATPRVEWVDVDGTGLPGVLVHVDGAWLFKQNTGDGDLEPAVALPQRPTTALATRPQLLDVLGTGRVALVHLDGEAPGYRARRPDGSWSDELPFARAPRLDWNDPNLRLLDLDGDGRADVLITDHEVMRFHRFRGEVGWDPEVVVERAIDDRLGPQLLFSDPTGNTLIADMTGDGLPDIVRVDRSNIEYWPNLGYGRFGPRVTMDDPPTLDGDDGFDARRVRLVDVDGSGPADLVYLGGDGVRVWANRAGNGWGPEQLLATKGPSAEELVEVVDLFGRGTPCLVWSSALPSDAGRPVRFLDLVGGPKPHLLETVENGIGGATEVAWSASTAFWLADRRENRAWATQLPFPLPVVERITSSDRITGTVFGQRFAYHHGHFDGTDREARGFAIVEQWDSDDRAATGAPGSFQSLAPEHRCPPVRTRTWFHPGTGIAEAISDERSAAAIGLPLASLPAGLTAAEEHEALRALTGTVLRSEIHGLDGTSLEKVPFSVAEHRVDVVVEQPSVDGDRPVVRVLPREEVTWMLERDAADPRIAHTLTLDVDPKGFAREWLTLAYPRRSPACPAQKELLAFHDVVEVAHVDQPDTLRLGVPLAHRRFAITNLDPTGVLMELDEARAALAGAVPVEPEDTILPAGVGRRLVGATRHT